MRTIPMQLKDCKFCRVRYKTKKPFERNWTKKLYSYEEIQPFLETENYGILTGVNSLAVLDDDTKDNQLLKLALSSFGETFRVRNHLYYKLKNWDEQKIIFWKNGDSSKKENHLGELQGKGQMVVGAGSVHPSGEVYELKNNIPIKEIDLEIFKGVFSNYIQFPPEIITADKLLEFDKSKVKYGSGVYESVSEIPITFVISSNQNVCLQHGAVTPPNFKVYDNYFRCFHCNSWGGVWLAIAIKHKIVNCSQAQGSNSLTKSQAEQVVEIAQQHYGLKKVEPIIQEPRGWACSINIKRMAKRHNLLNCPKCNIPFLFKEHLGFYKCKSCGDYGGLKRFALLCYVKNKFPELKPK